MKIVFFGQIKDALAVSQMEQVENYHTVAQLRRTLQRKGELWQELLSIERSLVAVNHELSDEDCKLNATDEVAFFPPVTGG